jgi:hypothetical protein
MLKKLQIDALNADLATVDALLASRSEDDDPVGWLQLKVRREEIEHEIQSLQPFRIGGNQTDARLVDRLAGGFTRSKRPGKNERRTHGVLENRRKGNARNGYLI